MEAGQSDLGSAGAGAGATCAVLGCVPAAGCMVGTTAVTAYSGPSTQRARLSTHHTCHLPEPPRGPRRAAVSTPAETRDGQGPGQGHRARAGLVSSEAVFQPLPRLALGTIITLLEKPHAGSCPNLGHGPRRERKWNPAHIRDRPDFQETNEGLLGGRHGRTVVLTASGVGEVQVASALDGAVSHLGKNSRERGTWGWRGERRREVFLLFLGSRAAPGSEGVLVVGEPPGLR